ncbi:hypothetical protein LCGC14_0298290 [marine sediment metagenome]|uniref:Uncharacterized protein n=1 Tax=marine sediment metagenome TaxID=412755 RepID=A0A0F9TW78_9ZZZZ
MDKFDEKAFMALADTLSRLRKAEVAVCGELKAALPSPPSDSKYAKPVRCTDADGKGLTCRRVPDSDAGRRVCPLGLQLGLPPWNFPGSRKASKREARLVIKWRDLWDGISELKCTIAGSLPQDTCVVYKGEGYCATGGRALNIRDVIDVPRLPTGDEDDN